MTPDEVIDPVDPEVEDKVDPFVKGLVARDLEKGMGANARSACVARGGLPQDALVQYLRSGSARICG